MSLGAMGLAEAAAALHEGRITSRELVDSCLERIEAHEDTVKAWQFLDPSHARAQADRLDDHRRAGRPLGPLHGVPIGLKDIIDTADMPTEYGSPLFRGRRPRRDATVTAKLREAGAVVMGKTITTEFAAFTPGKTSNPHDPARTPGGSSSGSAAAVAAFMVPGALGSQTASSVIRPAAFCGIYGFKPTFGRLSRHGVLCQSPALDHLGTFARSLEDIALLTEVLCGYDPLDPATAPPQAGPPLREALREEPPVSPRIAFAKTAAWSHADADMQEAVMELRDALGDRCDEIDLPDSMASALEGQRILMTADIAKNFAAAQDRGADQISARFNELIEEGRQVSAVTYNNTRELQESLNDLMDEYFDSYDAVLTASATGEAPSGLQATGNPVFGSTWTFLGLPAVTLPLFQGSNGLPMGAQLIGQKGDDARLLRTARWLERHVSED